MNPNVARSSRTERNPFDSLQRRLYRRVPKESDHPGRRTCPRQNSGPFNPRSLVARNGDFPSCGAAERTGFEWVSPT
jgi:hypothetical protein